MRRSMVNSSIVRVVGLCSRHPWAVIAVALIVAVLSGGYAAKNFALSTDISKLFPAPVPRGRLTEIFAGQDNSCHK
jgi:uncharacterized protein